MDRWVYDYFNKQFIVMTWCCFLLPNTDPFAFQDTAEQVRTLATTSSSSPPSSVLPCTHTHTLTHMRICVYVCTYCVVCFAQTYASVCKYCVCIHTHTHTYVAWVHSYAHTHVHTRTYTSAYRRKLYFCHTHTLHTHNITHTHTHTKTDSDSTSN